MGTQVGRLRRQLLRLVLPLLAGGVLADPRARARGQGEDAGLAEQFLREAPARWEEYARRAEELQGAYTATLSGSVGDVTGKARNELKRNRQCRLVVTESRETAGGKDRRHQFEAIGYNPNYGFRLVRKAPDAPWTVAKLVDLRSTPAPAWLEEPSDMTALTFHLRLDLEPLAEAVRKPEFRVVSAREVARDGETLAEVVFDNSHTPGDRASMVMGGKMLLDPGRFWCLRAYEVRTATTAVKGTMKLTSGDFRQTRGSMPFPRVVEYDNHFVNNEGVRSHQVRRYEYDLDTPRSPPGDEEFTLTAFGLPEPAGLALPKRGVPLFVWVAAAGLACLALGVAFRALRKRDQGAPASP
jgi:hypothetical protein